MNSADLEWFLLEIENFILETDKIPSWQNRVAVASLFMNPNWMDKSTESSSSLDKLLQYSLKDSLILFSTKMEKTFRNKEALSWRGDKVIKVIEEYLNIILMLLQCKESATRLPKQAWNDIESRILLPQEKDEDLHLESVCHDFLQALEAKIDAENRQNFTIQYISDAFRLPIPTFVAIALDRSVKDAVNSLVLCPA